jgi:hypothetical protein
MGILDNKTRIIDAIVTSEGRRQIALGDLRIKFATFTDGATFYEADAELGSSDATNRIYLEACNLPQDQIVFEADDSGRLMPFGAETDKVLKSGQLLSYSFTASSSENIEGSRENLTILKGAEFASQIEGILTGSIDNFSKLRIIGTYDPFLEDDDFAIGPNSISFAITDKRPLDAHIPKKCNVNDLESLFNDPRLANAKNFKYLPPINKQPKGSTRKYESKDRIGDYSPWGGASYAFDKKKAYEVLRSELQFFEQTGFMKTITFDPTSNRNSVIGQMFEISDRVAKKLDVIHYGGFSTIDSASSFSDVFFVGKVVVDDQETQSFIHLFTLVFE